jgi:hypothetical protein
MKFGACRAESVDGEAASGDGAATACLRAFLLSGARRFLEHDPEKWIPVFGKRSCFNKNLSSAILIPPKIIAL